MSDDLVHEYEEGEQCLVCGCPTQCAEGALDRLRIALSEAMDKLIDIQRCADQADLYYDGEVRTEKLRAILDA